VIAAAALGAAPAALAHDAAPVPAPGSVEVVVVVLIALAGAVYARGVAQLWRTGRGRGVSRVQVTAFALGLAALAIAAGGPLEALASRSFAAHMLQHEALMLIAAPLLVAGRPLATWTWALPRSWRPALASPLRSRWWTGPWSALSGPNGASPLQLALVIGWHAPVLFDAAARSAPLHAAQHTCFLAAALCFWWAMLRAARAGAGAFAAIAWMFVTMVVTGALGAALTFSPTVWYATYAGTAGALDDQQLGGLLMWVPGGLVYVVAALALGAHVLERRAPVVRAREA
jgi:cytochrome c oxidase assembly factor CtaG